MWLQTLIPIASLFVPSHTEISITPNFSLNSRNRGAGKLLVKISASISFVEIHGTLISLFSIKSSIYRCRILMLWFLFCYLDATSIDWNIFVACCLNPSSSSSIFNYVTFFPAFESAMYSASDFDSATVGCFLDCHDWKYVVYYEDEGFETETGHIDRT